MAGHHDAIHACAARIVEAQYALVACILYIWRAMQISELGAPLTPGSMRTLDKGGLSNAASPCSRSMPPTFNMSNEFRRQHLTLRLAPQLL
jgi:hypothetical protein